MIYSCYTCVHFSVEQKYNLHHLSLYVIIACYKQMHTLNSLSAKTLGNCYFKLFVL